MEQKLEDLVKRKLVPKDWVESFPRGYRVECRVVSTKYLSRVNRALAGGGLMADALAISFGDMVLNDVKLPSKTARVYFNISMSVDRFLHIYFHELHHCFIEWTGEKHDEMLKRFKGA